MKETQLLQVIENIEIIEEHIDVLTEINTPNPTIF